MSWSLNMPGSRWIAGLAVLMFTALSDAMGQGSPSDRKLTSGSAGTLGEAVLRESPSEHPRVELQMDRERLWAGDRQVSGRIRAIAAREAAKTRFRLSLWLPSNPSHPLAEKKVVVAGSSVQEPFQLDTVALPEGECFLTCEMEEEGEGKGGVVLTKKLIVGRVLAEPESGRIPLKVDWPPAAQPAHLWPQYSGVSFPAGTLTEESHIRLVTETGEEIPCQTEVLSRWGPGGSIQWLGLRFNGRPGTSYVVEYGTKVRRVANASPRISVQKSQKGLLINTGSTKFELPATGPLISRIVLRDIPIAENPHGMLVLQDQKGAVATEVGGPAEEAPQIETAGDLQTIVRREGALRTPDGKVLGRYVVRLTFAANLGVVLVEHTFIMTRSSRDLQIAELAIRVSPTLPAPWQIAFDIEGENNSLPWKTWDVKNPAGANFWMFQKTFPHHGQTGSEFLLGHDSQEVLSGKKAGESMAVWNSTGGIGLTMLDLAKLFPKELALGKGMLTAKLWSSRGGRLLDYRAPAIADFLGTEWLNARFPGGAEAFRQQASESISTARTHDLALWVFEGGNDALERAHALGETAAQPPYACQDPVWLQETRALGPVSAYNPRKFPRVEAFLREFFQQCLLGQSERFGDYGFLDYGAGPHNYTTQGIQMDIGADWPQLGYRYSGIDYGMRTSIWLAYARSGERGYRSYAEAINRHLYDFRFSQWASPERPLGAEINGFGSEDSPLYWIGKSYRVPAAGGHQGFDVENHLYQYFLTGDRRARDVVLNFGNHLKSAFDPSVLPDIGSTASNYRAYGSAAVLYGQTWDPAFVRLTQESRRRLVDLRTTTGLVNQKYFGAMYKPEARSWAVWKDYEATGAAEAGASLVRLAQHEVTEEPTHAAGYQDHSSAFFQVAYDLTGEQRLADWINTRLMRLAFAYTTPDGHLQGHPYEGSHSSNVIQAIAYGLDLIERTQDRIQPRPLFSQGTRARGSWLALEKGEDSALGAEVVVGRSSDLTMLSLADQSRKSWMAGYSSPLSVRWVPWAPTLRRNGLRDAYAEVAFPLEMLGGIYKLSQPETVLSAHGGRVSLVAPEGLFYDAAQVGAAPLYFLAPAGSSGTITVNRPALLHQGEKSVSLPPGTPVLIQGVDKEALCYVTTDAGVLYVRLDGDLPPVFARSAEDLWIPPGLPPRASSSATAVNTGAATGSYAPGSSGSPHDQSIRLSGKNQLEIPRGRELSPGVFENFDTRQGTLEFWFRPDKSSALRTQRQEVPLVAMGPWGLMMKTDQEPRTTGKAENVALSGTHLDWIVLPQPPATTAQRLVNPHDFWQDTWHHIALCWKTDPEAGWVSELYVDGQPALDWNRDGIMSRFRSGDKNEVLSQWRPAAPPETLVFPGGIEGRIDQIRISAICRYPQAFVPPPVGSLEADKNTLLLFQLDGHVEGVGSEGGRASSGFLRP